MSVAIGSLVTLTAVSLQVHMVTRVYMHVEARGQSRVLLFRQ